MEDHKFYTANVPFDIAVADHKFYTANVPFDIAVALKKAGYWNPGCTYESSYNNPCYFIPSKKYYAEGVIAPWDELVPAPTYAEVYDWFIKQDMVVSIDYESLNPITWTYNIQFIGARLKAAKECGHCGLIITEDQFDSFTECFDSAIKTAVQFI